MLYLTIIIFFILSREYVLFNEEFLFIISFLLVFYFLFNSLSVLFSSSLDHQALEIVSQMRNFSVKKINAYKEVRTFLQKSISVVLVIVNMMSFYIYALERGTERVNILRKFFWFEHFRDFIRAFVVLEVNIAKQFLNAFVVRLKAGLVKNKSYKRYYKKSVKRSYTSSNVFKFINLCNFKTKVLVKLR